MELYWYPSVHSCAKKLATLVTSSDSVLSTGDGLSACSEALGTRVVSSRQELLAPLELVVIALVQEPSPPDSTEDSHNIPWLSSPEEMHLLLMNRDVAAS